MKVFFTPSVAIALRARDISPKGATLAVTEKFV